MRTLSELNNEQLMELIESIKKKNGGETNARNWSKEDIDRLLELTDRGKQLERLEDARETAEEQENLPTVEKRETTAVEETEIRAAEEPHVFDISEEHEAVKADEKAPRHNERNRRTEKGRSAHFCEKSLYVLHRKI